MTKPLTPFESLFAHLTDEERGRLVFKYDPPGTYDESQDGPYVVRVRLEGATDECAERRRLEDEQKRREKV